MEEYGYDYVKITDKRHPSSFIYGVFFNGYEHPCVGCLLMSENFPPLIQKDMVENRLNSNQWENGYWVEVVPKSEVLEFKRRKMEEMESDYTNKLKNLKEQKLNLALENPLQLVNNLSKYEDIIAINGKRFVVKI